MYSNCVFKETTPNHMCGFLGLQGQCVPQGIRKLNNAPPQRSGCQHGLGSFWLQEAGLSFAWFPEIATEKSQRQLPRARAQVPGLCLLFNFLSTHTAKCAYILVSKIFIVNNSWVIIFTQFIFILISDHFFWSNSYQQKSFQLSWTCKVD